MDVHWLTERRLFKVDRTAADHAPSCYERSLTVHLFDLEHGGMDISQLTVTSSQWDVVPRIGASDGYLQQPDAPEQYHEENPIGSLRTRSSIRIVRVLGLHNDPTAHPRHHRRLFSLRYCRSEK